MDISKHYIVSDTKENGVKNEGWVIIPIWKIILDKGMEEKAKEVCDDTCKGSNIKKFKNGNIIPLSKWDKVSNDFDSNKPLDPIKVKPFKQTDYYEVIDGRHRCMVSHHNGHTHVPCNVYEEL
jgi:hypothetical protein